MSRYSSLLEQYAQLANFTDISSFVEAPQVDFDDFSVGLTVEDDENHGDIVLFTRLGTPSAQVDRETLYALMLRANAFWGGTGGGTLALHGEDAAALFCVRLPLATTTPIALDRVMNAFVHTSKVWRDVVQGRIASAFSPVAH